jgi:hypothetical protein
MGPSANLYVKADGLKNQKLGKKYELAYGKNKIFSSPAILLRWIAGGPTQWIMIEKKIHFDLQIFSYFFLNFFKAIFAFLAVRFEVQRPSNNLRNLKNY